MNLKNTSTTSQADKTAAQYQVLRRFNIAEGSDLFGSSVVINDNGDIFIGDPGVGKVFSYLNAADGFWKASKVITAPNDIKGFGYDLAIDGETLVIGAYHRVKKEDGAVFSYSRKTGLQEVARSDANHIVGFAVAAHSGRIAYSRRLRNDPEKQSGSVIVLRGGESETYFSREYPDYFGSSISLHENKLFVLAPAVDGNGGAIGFDVLRGVESKVKFEIPSDLGRANVANEVLVSDGLCVISGAGSRDKLRSVIWRECNPKDAKTINASGHVAASKEILAFAGVRAVPRFGVTGPFAVDVYKSGDFEERLEKVKSPKLVKSLTRNVDISDNYLVVALVDNAGKAFLEIYETALY